MQLHEKEVIACDLQNFKDFKVNREFKGSRDSARQGAPLFSKSKACSYETTLKWSSFW